MVTFSSFQAQSTLFGHGGGDGTPLRLRAVGLRVHVGDRGPLASVAAVAHLIADHEDDDENQDGGDDYAPDDNDHGAAQELGLHEVAAQVLGLRGELHAAHDPRGRQRGDAVVVDGQHAEVVLRPCGKVIHQEVFTRWGNHSVG